MRLGATILFGLSSLAIAGQAFAVPSMYNFRDDNLDQYVTFVDFSTTTADPTHYQWTTFPNPNNTGELVKFMDFRNRAYSGYTCLEYKAYKPGGIVDTDVVLWGNVSAGSTPVWQRLADDTLGIYPVARVSLQGSVNEQIPLVRLSPYYAAGNSGAVMLQVTELALTQAQCEATTGPLFKYPSRQIVNAK
jgi:hypothetical protein